MPPIVLAALALSAYAPQILRYFGAGDKPVAVAEKVVAIAQAATGAPSGEAALAKLKADSAARRSPSSRRSSSPPSSSSSSSPQMSGAMRARATSRSASRTPAGTSAPT
jgi:type IV secretory pathway TrbL component